MYARARHPGGHAGPRAMTPTGPMLRITKQGPSGLSSALKARPGPRSTGTSHEPPPPSAALRCHRTGCAPPWPPGTSRPAAPWPDSPRWPPSPKSPASRPPSWPRPVSSSTPPLAAPPSTPSPTRPARTTPDRSRIRVGCAARHLPGPDRARPRPHQCRPARRRRPAHPGPVRPGARRHRRGRPRHTIAARTDLPEAVSALTDALAAPREIAGLLLDAALDPRTRVSALGAQQFLSQFAADPTTGVVDSPDQAWVNPRDLAASRTVPPPGRSATASPDRCGPSAPPLRSSPQPPPPCTPHPGPHRRTPSCQNCPAPSHALTAHCAVSATPGSLHPARLRGGVPSGYHPASGEDVAQRLGFEPADPPGAHPQPAAIDPVHSGDRRDPRLEPLPNPRRWVSQARPVDRAGHPWRT